MRTFQTLNVSEIVTEKTGNIRLNQWEVTRPGSCSVDIRTNKVGFGQTFRKEYEMFQIILEL